MSRSQLAKASVRHQLSIGTEPKPASGGPASSWSPPPPPVAPPPPPAAPPPPPVAQLPLSQPESGVGLGPGQAQSASRAASASDRSGIGADLNPRLCTASLALGVAP